MGANDRNRCRYCGQEPTTECLAYGGHPCETLGQSAQAAWEEYQSKGDKALAGAIVSAGMVFAVMQWMTGTSGWGQA